VQRFFAEPLRRLASFAIVLPSVLTAAACSSANDRFSLAVSSQAISVPLGQALVVPPPGGPAVIAVRQTAYENAIAQNITLATHAATPGQNEIVVRAFDDRPADDQPGFLQDTRLSPDVIARELEEQFPGVDMKVSLVYVQNKYGPFGFAIGEPGNGDQCLYAWQRIEKTDRSLLSYEGGVVSIRLRLCAADKTIGELLRVAYGYTFLGHSRTYGWNPLEEPPGPSADIGATSVPIYPVAPSFSDNVTSQPPRPVGRASRIRTGIRPSPSTPDVGEQADMEPLPGYPTVPEPRASGSVDE